MLGGVGLVVEEAVILAECGADSGLFWSGVNCECAAGAGDVVCEVVVGWETGVAVDIGGISIAGEAVAEEC